MNFVMYCDRLIELEREAFDVNSQQKKFFIGWNVACSSDEAEESRFNKYTEYDPRYLGYLLAST